jgi:CDK inhibitor PHO81
VQPVFNRDVIAGLSDSAASSLLELEAWINGEEFVGSREAIDESNFPLQAAGSHTLPNLESDLINAMTRQDVGSAALVSQLSSYPEDDQRTTITTVFLRTISEGSIDSLEFLLGTGLVDTTRTDEITDRGCLHEAAIAGRLDILQLCVAHGITFVAAMANFQVQMWNKLTFMGAMPCTTLVEMATKT